MAPVFLQYQQLLSTKTWTKQSEKNGEGQRHRPVPRLKMYYYDRRIIRIPLLKARDANDLDDGHDTNGRRDQEQTSHTT
jgi:hypothetical protein